MIHKLSPCRVVFSNKWVELLAWPHILLGSRSLKFLEVDCAGGPREDGTASVPRGAAKLFMSETSPSPPLNFYSDFQNAKLNAQTLRCITASTENPLDAAVCVHVHVCYAPERHSNLKVVRFAFLKAVAVIRRNEGCWFYSIKLSCCMEGKKHGMNLWKAGKFTKKRSHSF